MELKDLTVAAPRKSKRDWNDEGVVILKNALSEQAMQTYEDYWIAQHAEIVNGDLVIHSPGGWPYATPYRDHAPLADLLAEPILHETMHSLLGEPVGLHLNLTGWVTTTRNWHQDSYLNPPHVGDYYVAVWIAFDTIHPDSGPFQYVPGSHRWPQVTREKILAALEPDERDGMWPTYSERLLTPLFEQEIIKRKAEVVTYLPERGDVLFWHGRLLHRGSVANVPGMQRRSLIAHYSGINHREDMPAPVQRGVGWEFPVDDRMKP